MEGSVGSTMPDVAGLSIAELYSLAEATIDRLAEVSTTSLSSKDVAGLAYTHELVARKLTGVGYQRVLDVEERSAYTVAGYTTLSMFLAAGLRLGRSAANRRLTAARATGERRGITGETLPPNRPATAEAVEQGAISEDHITVIESVLDKLPSAVPPDRVTAAETQLAANACLLSPTDLAKVGDRILAHLDPDGTLTDHRDRQRQRGLTLSPQDRQLMSSMKAHLTPAVRAQFDTILNAWAAPGMNNPDDPTPLFGAVDDPDLDPHALADARTRDIRSQAQRNHDALAAICRYVLGHKGLGEPHRLPTELVITTSLSELASQTGFATTATGTDLPIGDLIELAANAHPWLEVFKDHTHEILHLGRANRFASKAQRLALFGRDRGCTSPNCDVPFSRTQAHHAPDWALGGATDIDHLGAACGKHNRAVGTQPGHWETTILTHGPHTGRMAWRPTGSHDTWQVNPIHHPHLAVKRIETVRLQT
ncbi:hypothetical protein GOEFS_018_00680 [Gordonia effusa NBRC 100432]|uniref:HNH nuclease domain-containing protein n=1 Tax=Gordonia effusa NBRC 100432 TaxID=1077974 RepID=H0QW35_9ACTN|nr:DUF222 domain-containing protein [Gordonia effusa]GAB17036.1 hypothetical protein GOEFS_018_00680 [Gordonia effusa NBRC 100432]